MMAGHFCAIQEPFEIIITNLALFPVFFHFQFLCQCEILTNKVMMILSFLPGIHWKVMTGVRIPFSQWGIKHAFS